VKSIIFKGCFGFYGSNYCFYKEGNLSGPFKEPVLKMGFDSFFVAFSEEVSEGSFHIGFNFDHPFFNRGVFP
jgi:hypothetical protein